ncbi:aminopeptidase [Noviherbaspirillum pedocola]|nr:aminopeptidase [Noviherbaspirillum pedocola]
MKKNIRIALLAGAAALAAMTGGCAQMGYYLQAAQGQYALLAQARPIDDWLADPATGDTLKTKLSQVRAIRRFAAEELGLPNNGSYKNYADLQRPYVVWNVVAAPRLSLEPTQWCFPIAGCVNYRGYYHKEDAQAFARQLRNEGLDVQVAGVPAYSTLGWFDDPVLSTFIKYPEGELARLVFHELAHQVAYAKGDSQFNESFAVAVEEVGVERWMAKFGDDKMRRAYTEYEGRKQDFLDLLLKHREELKANYASDASDEEKLRRKAEIFQALQDDYQILKRKWGGYAGYDRWFAEPLSNAHLAAVATYHDFVPGFRALLQQEGSLPAFYAAVKRMAREDKSERDQQLALLGEPAHLAQDGMTRRNP